jgi:hypothetical protein
LGKKKIRPFFDHICPYYGGILKKGTITMTTMKKVMGIAALALVLAACSTGNAQDGSYRSGDSTFRSGNAK